MTRQPPRAKRAHAAVRLGANNGHSNITSNNSQPKATSNGHGNLTGNGHAAPTGTGHGNLTGTGHGNLTGNGHAAPTGNGHPTITHVPSFYDRFGKPVIDRLGALVLLVALLPVLLAVTIAVWVKLGPPVLLRQPRVGQGGRVFGMLKFRTMLPDRRERRKPVPPERDRRQTHKSAHDPRHTDLGRFLRRTSLDELPQLLNVLAGHMSLVGPRPELADVVDSVYEPWQLQRHQVKPGITGLWQITERAEGDGVMHHHTEIDLAYIERLSLATDLRILVQTPLAVVSSRNGVAQHAPAPQLGNGQGPA